MVMFLPGRRTSGENDDGRVIHSSKNYFLPPENSIIERRLLK